MAITERLYPLQDGQFGSKNKIAKNMRKLTLESLDNCSMQKTDLKNSLYSKNERILKMGKNGHQAEAIAFGKWSVWVKK